MHLAWVNVHISWADMFSDAATVEVREDLEQSPFYYGLTEQEQLLVQNFISPFLSGGTIFNQNYTLESINNAVNTTLSMVELLETLAVVFPTPALEVLLSSLEEEVGLELATIFSMLETAQLAITGVKLLRIGIAIMLALFMFFAVIHSNKVIVFGKTAFLATFVVTIGYIIVLNNLAPEPNETPFFASLDELQDYPFSSVLDMVDWINFEISPTILVIFTAILSAVGCILLFAEKFIIAKYNIITRRTL
ncbi:MAG: hypothetical protein FWG68_04455 [Defluviitaleaceae bacterium]|nr:hypothetical protein [Defluviitaleaceae bacterium]